ncbi:Translation initiation factor 2 [Gulosibacter sp. 10]|nr:Translation initiation factor 2 [Gulosibacter sp. 10]
MAPGFDQTGIVPLPSRMQEPQRSDAEKRAQSRAAEFYGTGPVGRNPAAAAAGAAAAATGPGEAGQRGDADAAGAEQPRPENPFLAAARAAEQSEQRPPERSGGMPDLPPIAPAEPVPGPAPQGSAPRPEPEAPEFTSPFVTEATTPQQARAARQPEPEEGFWPFGDEFQQEQSAPRRSEPQDDVDALFGAGTGAVGGGGSVGGGGAGGFGGGSGTGAGGGGGGSSDEASTKRNGVKLILIAAIAAIVIVIGAFALRPLFGGGADEASEPTTEQTEEQGQQGDPDGGETDSGEETPEPTEDAPEQFDPVAFQSGSGNLRCQIDPENGAVCQLVTVNFTPPAEQCESGAARGTTVGVGQEGITWPCLTGDLPGGEVVEYDVPITAGDYTCSINYTTGVTCENGKGDEFSLEFNSGVATTGETAGESQPEVSPIG